MFQIVLTIYELIDIFYENSILLKISILNIINAIDLFSCDE